MDKPLNGRAAAHALELHFGLAATNARFNRRKVAMAVRTRAGRGRLAGALACSRTTGAHRRLAELRPAVRPRARAARRRAVRLSRSRGPSGPTGPEPPAPGSRGASGAVSAAPAVLGGIV